MQCEPVFHRVTHTLILKYKVLNFCIEKVTDKT